MSQKLPRILFADQLGPHFVEDQDVIIPEVLGPFRRRRYHRQKAHLILSALRHRSQELGERATVLRGETYHDVLGGLDASVVNPTSWGLRALVSDLSTNADIEVHPSRGFVASEAEFQAWAS
ncbi:MAG: cryptochrome/photolyase family protein, partial [Pontimonas sp.]